MQRKLTNDLLVWKRQTTNRKALLLYGARQVGKTYAIQEFGAKHYKHYIELNFESTPALASIFEPDLDPNRIIQTIEVVTKTPVIPGETLIFLDEVQLCGKALTSLKYFTEQTPEIHVIAAGSLLGVTLNPASASFPVGKVEKKTLYPLDFEEFLWALGQDVLANEIRRCYDANEAINGALHEQALQLYRTYLCVGGMPDVVAKYANSKSLLQVTAIQSGLIDGYIADMSKYAGRETPHVIASYNSIPAQLAKDNKKFQYKLVQRGGSVTLFGPALDWLTASRMVLKCKRVENAAIPLAVNADESAFKLYLADIGLFLALAKIPVEAVLLSKLGTFSGAVTENYLAQALDSNGHSLYYWQSGNTAELDYLLTLGIAVIPLEAKAADNTKSKSLGVFVQKYNPPYSFRVSGKNFGFENNIRSIPLYAAFCIGAGKEEL